MHKTSYHDPEFLGEYIYKLNSETNIPEEKRKGAAKHISLVEAYRIARLMLESAEDFPAVPIHLVISACFIETCFTEDYEYSFNSSDFTTWRTGIAGVSIRGSLRKVYGKKHTNKKLYYDSFSAKISIENLFKSLNRAITVSKITDSCDKGDGKNFWMYVYSCHAYPRERQATILRADGNKEIKARKKVERVVDYMYRIADSEGFSPKLFDKEYKD